jgi:hypothetical protein
MFETPLKQPYPDPSAGPEEELLASTCELAIRRSPIDELEPTCRERPVPIPEACPSVQFPEPYSDHHIPSYDELPATTVQFKIVRFSILEIDPLFACPVPIP